MPSALHPSVSCLSATGSAFAKTQGSAFASQRVIIVSSRLPLDFFIGSNKITQVIKRFFIIQPPCDDEIAVGVNLGGSARVPPLKGGQNSAQGFNPGFNPGLGVLMRCALVRHMLKNNVPAPSCIPPAGLEVLTRRYPIVPIEKTPGPPDWEC
jgi:hypothetical protein